MLWCTNGSPVGLDHIYFFFGFLVGFAGGRPFVVPYVPLPCGISYSSIIAALAAARSAAMSLGIASPVSDLRLAYQSVDAR